MSEELKKDKDNELLVNVQLEAAEDFRFLKRLLSENDVHEDNLVEKESVTDEEAAVALPIVTTPQKMNKPPEQLEKSQTQTSTTALRLNDISLADLNLELDTLLLTSYRELQHQAKALFGESLQEKSVYELYETELGRYCQTLANVVANRGAFGNDAVRAVEVILPLLWKSMYNEQYYVPEHWHQTALGYLCQYIKVGQLQLEFDPIDVHCTAAILNISEEEVLNRVEELQGRCLFDSYVFSKRKIEEIKETRSLAETPSLGLPQQKFEHIKEALSELFHIQDVLNEAKDELYTVKSVLKSCLSVQGTLPQNVYQFVEHRLNLAFRKYIQIEHVSIASLYSVPNVFSPIEQYAGSVINGTELVHRLQDSFKLIEGELEKIRQLSQALAKQLERPNVETGRLGTHEKLATLM